MLVRARCARGSTHSRSGKRARCLCGWWSRPAAREAAVCRPRRRCGRSRRRRRWRRQWGKRSGGGIRPISCCRRRPDPLPRTSTAEPDELLAVALAARRAERCRGRPGSPHRPRPRRWARSRCGAAHRAPGACAGSSTRSRSARCRAGVAAAAPCSPTHASRPGRRPETRASAASASCASPSPPSPNSGDRKPCTARGDGAAWPRTSPPPQAGQRNPSGQRDANRYPRHPASSGKRRWNSIAELGKSGRGIHRRYERPRTELTG